MSNTNIDYAKDNEFLPQNLRLFIGDSNKIQVQQFDAFFTLFDGLEKYALMNNWRAAKFGSGWTILNHNAVQSGVLPRLLEIKTQKTVGKVYFQAPEGEDEKVSELLPKEYLSKVLYEAAEKGSMTGRCAYVLYSAEKENPYIVCYDAFRHKLIFNNKKEVIGAELFANKLESPTSNFCYFFVIEKRFYGKDGKPYQRICVTFQQFANERLDKVERQLELETKDIPDWLKEQFKGVNFNSDRELKGFTDLGVYHWDETAFNKKFPDLPIPEAMFVDVMDSVVMLENGLTDKEIEKEIGRAQIMIPEFGKEYQAPMTGAIPIGQSNIAKPVFGTNARKKSPIIQQYPTKSMEDCKPTNIQFEFRPDQWSMSTNEDICRICAIVGISITDYDARLLQQGVRTDDEINAITDTTVRTVTAARNLNEYEVNKLLACMSAIYGLKNPITIRWSMASILNPMKNAAMVQGLLGAGLISRKEAIKRTNPDLNENEIEELYQEIMKEQGLETPEVIERAYNDF